MGSAPTTVNYNGYTLSSDSGPIGASWKYKGQALGTDRAKWMDEILAIDKATNPKVPDAGDAVLREQAGFEMRKRSAAGMGLEAFVNPLGVPTMKGLPMQAIPK